MDFRCFYEQTSKQGLLVDFIDAGGPGGTLVEGICTVTSYDNYVGYLKYINFDQGIDYHKDGSIYTSYIDDHICAWKENYFMDYSKVLQSILIYGLEDSDEIENFKINPRDRAELNNTLNDKKWCKFHFKEVTWQMPPDISSNIKKALSDITGRSAPYKGSNDLEVLDIPNGISVYSKLFTFTQ